MPSPERRREIEGIVDKIIASHDLKRPGFDLVTFLTKSQSFTVGLQDLDSDTTGLLLVNDSEYIEGLQTHRLIVLNNFLKTKPNYLRRRRFITAHEFGHFILHKEGKTIFAHRDYSSRETPEEKEADFFARCLLMPRSLVREVLSVGEVDSIDIEEKVALIARTFNVTEKKARQRLTEDLVCQ